MKPMQLAAVPASAVAAGVLMPSWVPNRRLVSATVLAGACAASDLARGEEYIDMRIVPDLPGLSKAQMKQVHSAVGYGVKALALQTVVEAVRLLSFKDRVTGAALAGGAYVLASSQLAAFVERTKVAVADAQDDAEDEVVAAHAS